MSKLHNTSVLQLLPDSLKRDPDAIAAAESLSSRTLFKKDMNELLVLFEPDSLAERDKALLDYLFQQEHVDLSSLDLDAKTQAELIYMSPAIHMKKGTSWAVQQVVSTVFANAKVVEWFDYDGDPYKFKVQIETDTVQKGDISRLHSVVNTAKNLRSSMDTAEIIVANSIIELKAETYTIPVVYPITNMFTTAEVHGGLAKADLIIKTETYSFKVPYLITNEFYAQGHDLIANEEMELSAETMIWTSKIQRLSNDMIVGEVNL